MTDHAQRGAARRRWLKASFGAAAFLISMSTLEAARARPAAGHAAECQL
jgi:hypothetical protein